MRFAPTAVPTINSNVDADDDPSMTADRLELYFSSDRDGDEDLVAAETHLFAASLDGTLVGVGGYQVIETGHAEIKSMHTVQEARGKGAGRAILDAIFASARGQGVTKVSLETGSADDFAAARSLYQAYGFTLCPPFGHYTLDPLSVFMSREL